MMKFYLYTHAHVSTTVKCLSSVSAPIKWELDRVALLINTNHRNNYSAQLKCVIDFQGRCLHCCHI